MSDIKISEELNEKIAYKLIKHKTRNAMESYHESKKAYNYDDMDE